MLLLLSRLGHYLGVRKYLAGFVVTAYTGNILPRLIRRVALSVIQRNHVLDWRQKLKLALWKFPKQPSACVREKPTPKERTIGFGSGTAGFDGAYERREGYFAVLRRTKWRVFGEGRGPV
jgi:hypothetical protein